MNLQTLSLTALITIGISILGLWLFRKLGVLDKPRLYVQPQRDPVPTVQGIFVILIFVVVLGLFFPEYFFTPKLWGLHIGIAVILIMALRDQYIGISSKIRLLIQIIISAAAIYFGDLVLKEFLIQDIVYHIPYRI
jgi:UDP-N-acetylmuramyl pentapeptide phosphotransferase/UDP-N-acetylglucosamine-1-phosphate transferase